jgi:hypothetical protein
MFVVKLIIEHSRKAFGPKNKPFETSGLHFGL